jgi:hypothetical protein
MVSLNLQPDSEFFICLRSCSSSKVRSNLSNERYPQAAPPIAPRNLPSGHASDYVQSYTNRQSRYDARADRRFNDWFLFGIPSPLLWLEGGCSLENDDGLPCGNPVIVELWP